ncbi:MAG: OmpA family protein [Rhizobiales bacterium]|nr:OmpA family protein [Hyphomicrobiales bacterium]NRB14913.1 OmpA family protein [Hyphomicrobiales bacterium]
MKNLLYFALLICMASVQTAFGNSSPPKEIILLDWKQTVALEHEDRKNRILENFKKYVIGEPKFYTYLIKADEMPQYDIDIPVLRIELVVDTFFDTDKDIVKPSASRALEFLANNFRADVPDLSLFITGHADSRGSNKYNLDLSNRRARNVAKYLHGLGVGFANIWSIGFGEMVPLVTNNSQINMARNRRVEFIIAAKPEAIAVFLAKQNDAICDVLKHCDQYLSVSNSFIAIPVQRSAEEINLAKPEDTVIVSKPKMDIKIDKEIQNVNFTTNEKTIQLDSKIMEIEVESKLKQIDIGKKSKIIEIKPKDFIVIYIKSRSK